MISIYWDKQKLSDDGIGGTGVGDVEDVLTS